MEPMSLMNNIKEGAMKPMSLMKEEKTKSFHPVRLLPPPIWICRVIHSLIRDQLVLGQWEPLGPLDLQRLAMGFHLDLEICTWVWIIPGESVPGAVGDVRKPGTGRDATFAYGSVTGSRSGSI